MKKLAYLFLGLALFACSLSSNEKKFTNQSIYSSNEFSGKTLQNVKWIDGGKKFSFQEMDPTTRTAKIYSHTVASGKKELILDTKDLKDGDKVFRFTSYQWSPDEKFILFADAPPSRQYFSRHLPGGNLFLYSIPTRQFRKLTAVDVPQYNFKFSPDGKKIGFVRNNNIYVLDVASGEEVQLTTDGGGSIINGRFDWVYEEEFSISDGWKWSPDGKYIAYWQFNEARVPEFNMIDHLSLRSDLMQMKYPKAGDPNSTVKIGVLNLETKKTVWVNTGKEDDIYIPRINWMADPNMLCITRLNRLQNSIELLKADVRSGKSETFFSEQEETWIDIHDDTRFFKKGDQFLWTSDRDGYSHFYIYDLNGSLKRQVTKGYWEVVNLVHFNEQNNRIYFIGGEKSVFEKHLYTVKLDGTGMKRLSPGDYSYSVNMSPDGKYFIGTYSNATMPPKVALFSVEGKLVRMLEENRIEALSQYKMGTFEFFDFTTTDGTKLNGWMIKPTDFDTTRKYPVLIYVYGGPGSQTVLNSWGGLRYLWHQMLAQKGYIVVSVDNRGTGMRGKGFKSVTYKNLGKWEVHDQIEAVKFLRNLPYVNASQIGIWGWSYGGYMASLSILVGADCFKAAVAVAPVTDWRFYDTIYTERFMQRPQDNEEGYRESASVNHAEKLKGNFLLIHGTTDDNVHWQNAVQLADALQKADKHFETVYYANKNHGISGGNTRAHLFEIVTRFLDEKLKGD